MIKELLTENLPLFQAALEHFGVESSKLRTGRANPALVEGISVDYYGTRTPLQQIASISIPEARQIFIQPWDKGAIPLIESAIRESDLGLNPGNDGQGIRIILPALNEERRRELVKALNSRAEDAKISIRSVREEIGKALQKAEQEGKIGEDDKFQGKEELQKVVDDYNQKLEVLRKKKEEEILTV